LDALGRQHIIECGTEFGVAVVQHVTAVAECSGVADSIASHLRHPGFGRVSGEAGEDHAPGLQVDKEEEVVCYETTPGQDLEGEEVCPDKDGHVGGDEVPPTGILASLRRWGDAVPVQNVPDCLM